ncbi:hypothetical protein FA95DRAFT_1225269 [Auriscalpium vulgare]|uniref:Uncharacterized protein n=1 Tax=Auriscalpium vulgare TaxID=40419 RepID=A0ACB8R2S8_9AGAM|nr:hypothetical protein FA95DRAFT_1225269 [Auriscalpium vulgare]
MSLPTSSSGCLLWRSCIYPPPPSPPSLPIETSSPVVENGHVSVPCRWASNALPTRPSSAQMILPEKTASHSPLLGAIIPEVPARIGLPPAASSAGIRVKHDSSSCATATSPLCMRSRNGAFLRPQSRATMQFKQLASARLDCRRSTGVIAGEGFRLGCARCSRTHIGIALYGRRILIANTIAGLRRPPSHLSDHLPAYPHSQSQYSLAVSSAEEPLGQQHRFQPSSRRRSSRFCQLTSLASPRAYRTQAIWLGTPSLPGRRDYNPGSSSQPILKTAGVDDSRPGIELGLGITAAGTLAKTDTGRPAQLLGSDDTLVETVKAVAGSAPTPGRAGLSESEPTQKYEQTTTRKGVSGRREPTSSKHKDKDVPSRNSNDARI